MKIIIKCELGVNSEREIVAERIKNPFLRDPHSKIILTNVNRSFEEEMHLIK